MVCVCCCCSKSGNFIILRHYDLVRIFQDCASEFSNLVLVQRDFIVLCLHSLLICIRKLFSLSMCVTLKVFGFFFNSCLFLILTHTIACSVVLSWLL